MKWLAQWRYRWHYLRMSEFGRELADEFQNTNTHWLVTQYTLTHKPSGIELWVSNGRSHFHVHAIPKTSLHDSDLRALLNWHDKYVLWEFYKLAVQKIKSRPAQTALNVLRLSRHKENQA